MRLEGYVEHIIYRNAENGYSVLNLMADENEITVVGVFSYIGEGELVELEGDYTEHPMYGQQFKAERFEVKTPKDALAMERYLASGAVKGVGAALAARIVRRFGAKTFEIMEREPERLSEVKGISDRKAREIAEQMEEKRDLRDAMVFLQEYGISMNLAVKIYQQYGQEIYRIIKENPYRLADDIAGVGFRTADEIAKRVGIREDSDFRIRSGILYTLLNASAEGHTCIPEQMLLNRTVELLGVPPESVERHVSDLSIDRKLIRKALPDSRGQETVFVYAASYYYAELSIAAMLYHLNLSMDETDAVIDTRISKIEKATKTTLDDHQREAVAEAVRNGLLILTGGPGTGKTTTINAMIHYFEAENLSIFLAAPTGRAAKRMTEATGLEAKTIHRLLECKPPEGYQKNEDNPLEGDVLIIDECSMIDMILMNALLKAIPEGMRLILVGDIDQLPSVGAGNVLRDIIDSGVFPVVRLTRIFRQAQSSRIIMNAHRINEGLMPDLFNGKTTDFFFTEKEDPEEAVAEIVNLVQTKLSRYYQTPSSQIQVLTPMQKGVVGATNLNLALQAALNPTGDGLRRSGYIFRVNDKVMQIRNNYDKEIFNGDIGIVASVDIQGRTLQVDFDGHLIEYDASELDELVHAYATTIHKAQGSEYPIVVMPVLMNHYVMLQRNLIYTGITRAKKILVLVGTKKAISYAVHHVTVNRRNTLLKERLQGEIQKGTDNDR